MKKSIEFILDKLSRPRFRMTLWLTGIMLMGYIGWMSVEYMDVGFIMQNEHHIHYGPQKNSISAVVAGIVIRHVYESAEMELELQRTLYFDSTMKVSATSQSIRADVEGSHFTAAIDDDSGLLEGIVKKKRWNWKVRQIDTTTYQIKDTIGQNYILTLDIDEGMIIGTFERSVFDWKIEGTVKKDGRLRIDIDGPFNLGVRLVADTAAHQADER